jgi:hypothetical protein
MDLTKEEKITNFETMRHINVVGRFINIIVKSLLDRSQHHDETKLGRPEVDVLTKHTPKLAATTYGSDEYKSCLEEMKVALDHHYVMNRHHPEHFRNGVEDMNLIDIIEMLCDWKAATLRHNDGNLLKSLEINYNRFGITGQLAKILENTARLFESKEVQ